MIFCLLVSSVFGMFIHMITGSEILAMAAFLGVFVYAAYDDRALSERMERERNGK